MQVTLTGQHIDVGNALRSHVEDVLAATIDKYFGDAIEANVVISREAFRLRADGSIHIGKGIFVRSHEEADDAYAAFDVAVAHLAKRLRRYKRRLRDYHNARDRVDAVSVPQYVLAAFGEEDEESAGGTSNAGESPVIVAENQAQIENLTVSERSEERRVGKGCVSTCSWRWAT